MTAQRGRNLTFLDVHRLPAMDRNGREVLVVIAKAAYHVDADGTVGVPDPPPFVRVQPEAMFLGQPSSLRHASDICDEKPGTDVLLVGTAHPPPGREVTSVLVGLRVGDRLDKTLRVHGVRVWQRSALGSVLPGPAVRLEPTPLVYELAFGGSDADEAAVRNPVGRGFATSPDKLVGKPAVQIESLDGKEPAGFGPIDPHWEPRASRSGTRDADWQRKRAPVRPVDFDPRANCVAPDDQWLERPLVGDEEITVVGATPEGVWRFRLPRYAPKFVATVRGEAIACDTHLDTFHIDSDRRRVELTWRTALPMPARPAWVEGIDVVTEDVLPKRLALGFAGG